MAAPQASSRLELLQARFQQKQLQEKEQKLLQLYDQQQQRAYQVVQRGSAGSNGSNHGSSSISQHTVTKTSTSNHTTSTSQGGKVRQMFDERRQTTVKGIDRSYPLEPLENKPRKQTNGNIAQKNGNLTGNRQSVTVKRVARADVNSNLNGGKPVVSYHEEITRESFGPSGHQHADDDEFGNENHIAQYTNGNHRDETEIEEVLDDDTIQKNRMMAKLHLMEYDNTLKHRVKNDLESEEFPNDYMVEIPDKVPKRPVARKLSQAEVRLERFKNANARRSNSVTKNARTTPVPKKRTDAVFPARSTSRANEVYETRAQQVLHRDARSRSPQNSKGKLTSMMGETLSVSGSEKNKGRSSSPQFYCTESEKSATTYAVNAKSDMELFSGTSKDRARPSQSPKFFCKESEKSATTYAIDSKAAKKLAPEFSKSRTSRRDATRYAIEFGASGKITPDFSKSRTARSESGKFYCEESEKSATTHAIDPKASGKLSPDFSKTRTARSESPEFFTRESEKSATTYAIDSKATKKLTPEFSKGKTSRSESPKYFCRESEESAATYAIDSKTKLTSPELKDSRNFSLGRNRKDVENFYHSGPGIDIVDRKSPEILKVSRTSTPERLRNQITNRKCVQSESHSKIIRNESPNTFKQLTKERSFNPKFSHRKSKVLPDNKEFKFTSKSSERIINKHRDSPKREDSRVRGASKSPDIVKAISRKSNTSPQFYTSDSERSATILFVTPETITKPRPRYSKSKGRGHCLANVQKKSSQDDIDRSSRNHIRSSVSRFFSEQCERARGNANVNARKDTRSTPIGKSPAVSRGSTPVSLKDMKTPGITSRSPSPTLIKISSKTSSRDSSPRSQKLVVSRSSTPEFFCYETEKSATTVSLKPKLSTDLLNKRTKSPGPKVTHESPAKSRDSKNVHLKSRSSKSPDDLTVKDTKVTRRGPGTVLRSTKLIRDIMKGQSNINPGNYSSKTDAKELRRFSGASADTVGISNVGGAELRHRSEDDEGGEVRPNRKVDKRATTPPTRTYEQLLTPESSPKSSTSAEVDVEIQEITMPDQYIKQEKLQSTYSKSSGKTLPGSDKSKTKNLLTYSVRRPGKNRESLLESNVFGPMKTSRKEQKTHYRNGSKQVKKSISLEHITLSTSRVEGSCSPSPNNEAIRRDSKRKTVENIVKKDSSGSRKQSPSSCQLKRKEGKASTDQTSGQARSLRSTDLGRNIVKEPKVSRNIPRYPAESSAEKIERRSSIKSITSDIPESKSKISSARDERSSSRDYGRTDSVESALRRFDSIGTASIQSTPELSKESMTEKGQTPEESSRAEDSVDELGRISLKALGRSNVNFPQSSPGKPLRTSLRKTSMMIASPAAGSSRKAKTSGTRGTRREKRFATARDSIEMTRDAIRSKSPACKRKLFRDAESVEETETESTRSKCSLESTKAAESLSSRRSEPNKDVIPDSIRTSSKRLKSASGGETPAKRPDKRGTDKTSTGASDPDLSLAVKQLRSIGDIRKSIESESSPSKSAIANNASRYSSATRNLENRAGCRREMLLPMQPGNFSARTAASEKRSPIKCTTRFSRVVKSPSPDLTKTADTSSRTRGNVPSSPSKSPDVMGRRPSTELKVHEAKSTKRPVPMKGSEPIGNRKTTTTTTRKSTDVVDGAILENGVHLRDQTAEPKYDNDSPTTTKKSDAFVIDLDEQPPKENDAPPLRKPLLRKQSTVKQTASAQSARPPSSVSSISSNGSMSGQPAVSRNKMATKAKTVSATSSKASNSSRNGGNMCTTDNLVPCKMCGRRFAQDRVTLHEQICTKTGQKKRKQFDTMIYRLRGTELEPFAKKAMNRKQPEKSKKPDIKTNWRRKHEDFINAIRSAKQVQAHLAAGGKLSDLPPPPPSDTSDYVQCPHCGRKFNQAAAERHIPKCEHMLHNKPAHSKAPRPRR